MSNVVLTRDIVVTFEDGSHQYTGHFPDGSTKVLPSVTQILEGVRLIDTQWYPQDAAFRGSMVHSITESMDRGIVSLDFYRGDSYYNLYEAWEQFKLIYRFRPVGIERTVLGCCDDNLYWAGRVDRDGWFDEEIVRDRYDLPRNAIIMLDLKSGRPERWHALQLEGYRQAYPKEAHHRIYKFAVYLKDTGLFDVRFHPEDLSEQWFECVQNYYRPKVAPPTC